MAVALLIGYGLWLALTNPTYTAGDLISDLVEAAIRYWWWVSGTVLAVFLGVRWEKTFEKERRFLTDHGESVGTNAAPVIGGIGGLAGIITFVGNHWDQALHWF